MEHPIPNSGNYLATGFQDVDAATGTKMVQCLTFLDSLPSFQEYKASIMTAINPQPGDIVADLGCGAGFDVVRFAQLVAPAGRAIGVDLSLTLLESARANSRPSRNTEFIRADIRELPFENAALSSCKVDRTLQHIDQPAAVLKEVFRTLRPGGIVACSEPDWETFTIDHDDRQMVRQIAEFWAESFRNPWIGRQLLNHLREAGFVEVSVGGTLLIAPSFEASDKVFDLIQTAARLADATRNGKALDWIARARQRDQSSPVWSSVTLFMNFARKPWSSCEA
jgi:ubiquinone/menaquinone biosynthesis C-methylase UbiE